jgi:hypothetical protein
MAFGSNLGEIRCYDSRPAANVEDFGIFFDVWEEILAT